MNQTERRTGALASLTASMLIFGTIGLFRRWIPVSSGLLALTRAVLGTLFLLGLRALGVTGPGRSEAARAGGGRSKTPRESGGRRSEVLRAGGDERSEAAPESGPGRSEANRNGGPGRSESSRALGGRQALLLPLSGALLGLNWMLLFEAYRHTTVAIATLCYYMQPTILIFLSPTLFREPLRGKQLVCALLSVAGMVLVSGVGGAGTDVLDGLGIGLGLAAAALYALIIVLNKIMGPVDPWRRTVVQLTAAACALLPYVLLTGGFQEPRLSGGALAALLVVGVVHTGVAYALYFSSMGKLPAQTLALFSYIDPVTALLLSALVLGEALSARGFVGAALILACAVFGEVSKENP